MDGRNLANDIIPNWDPSQTLSDVAKSVPTFVKKVLSSVGYYFYGKFELGAVFELSNYNNMLVNTFTCKLDNGNSNQKNNENDKEYCLVLSDDCIILFEKFEINPLLGKIVFWSTLFSISEMKVNKVNRIVHLSFYSDSNERDKQLKIIIQNVLFFREALVKRMSNLKVKIEACKLFKGQMQEKRITTKEINEMNIQQIEQHISYMKKKIEHNELSFYIIKSYSFLCRKAIEYYSANGDDKKLDLLNEMKTILMRKDVQKVMNDEEM